MQSVEHQDNYRFSRELFFEVLPKFSKYLSSEDRFELSLACDAIFNKLNSDYKNETDATYTEESDLKELVMSIFYNVAQYLDYKDVIEASAVCKALRNVLSPNLFKKVKLQDFYYESYKNSIKPTDIFIDEEIQSFKFLISKSSYIQSIRLNNGVISSYNANFFYDFSNLSAIKFANCGLTDTVLLSIFNELHFLKEFSSIYCNIYFTGCELICTLPESLKILWVRGKKLYIPYNVLKVLNTHKYLKKANISCHTMVEPFLNCYQSLKHLRISYCIDISFNDFVTILKRNPQIEKLSFSPGYLANNNFTQLTYMSQLTRLHISNGNLENSEIYSFPKNLKEVIIEAKLSNYSYVRVMRDSPHLVEIYFHIELSQAVYQEILKLNYIKIISFRSVNFQWVRRLSEIRTVKRLTWIKKPSMDYINTIVNRSYKDYNIQYINGQFSIIF